VKRVASGAEWERMRARGRRNFVVRYGVIRRGLPMALAVALALELYLGGRFPDALGAAGFWGRFALCAAVFGASGAITASATWSLYEKHFGKRR
jgi:hypothetical protein